MLKQVNPVGLKMQMMPILASLRTGRREFDTSSPAPRLLPPQSDPAQMSNGGPNARLLPAPNRIHMRLEIHAFGICHPALWAGSTVTPKSEWIQTELYQQPPY